MKARRAAKDRHEAKAVRKEGNATEALGAEPGPVKFNVTVMAAFDLKRPK